MPEKQITPTIRYVGPLPYLTDVLAHLIEGVNMPAHYTDLSTFLYLAQHTLANYTNLLSLFLLENNK